VTKSVASKPPQLITLQTIAAGLFHFLHNFFTILLLLQIGLIAGESESAKAKLLEIIFPAVFTQMDTCRFTFTGKIYQYLSEKLQQNHCAV
jgi:hypothetical protein